MNTLEMRKYLGHLKMDYITGKISKQQVLEDLDAIDWNTVEEVSACTKTSLQIFVDSTKNFINSRP